MSKAARRAVIIGVGLALIGAFLGEHRLRRRIEHRYQEALLARRQLALGLGELRTERDQLRDALSGERQQVEQLSASLSAKSKELQEMIRRMAQEERLIQTLQEKLVVMERQLNLMQGELAVALQAESLGGSVATERMIQLEKVVVTQPTSAGGVEWRGRVISIHPEWRFVVIDLGWDVVNIGDVVSIYRNDQFLGKARIERVQEQISAASLLPEWKEVEIQVNDAVRAL